MAIPHPGDLFKGKRVVRSERIPLNPVDPRHAPGNCRPAIVLSGNFYDQAVGDGTGGRIGDDHDLIVIGGGQGRGNDVQVGAEGQ